LNEARHLFFFFFKAGKYTELCKSVRLLREFVTYIVFHIFFHDKIAFVL